MTSQITAQNLVLYSMYNKSNPSHQPKINIKFSTNELIGLMGRNGSGKTTLVRLLSSVDKPRLGKIIHNPANFRLMLLLQRPEDQFVRETIWEQIHSYSSRKREPEEINQLMLQVGLDPELGTLSPIRISTGQQRLVAIACALATDTEMIILDEPMAGLDFQGRKMVRDALLQMRKTHNLGWIIVSHHPDDLLGLIDRVWILDHGEMIHDGDFASTPLNKLETCLSPYDPSLFKLLRELESSELIFHDSPYQHQDAGKVATILQESDIK